MPLTTETTDDCMGIIHVASGKITGEDFVGASKAAVQLVQSTRNFVYEFVDLSDAESVELDEEHLNQITAQDRLGAIYRPEAVIVIVAPRDDSFALAKMWETRVRDLHWTTHIARDRSEAIEWLRTHFPAPTLEKLDEQISSASPEDCVAG
jgi:hypothetical protein